MGQVLVVNNHADAFVSKEMFLKKILKSINGLIGRMELPLKLDYF